MVRRARERKRSRFLGNGFLAIEVFIAVRVHLGPKNTPRRFSKTQEFQGFFGAGFGAGLYRNLERFDAIRCEA